MAKKILLIGGPGTGKTSIINALKDIGYTCYDEISRKIILEARENGEAQQFLSQPLLFSKRLLEGRIKQHQDATEHKDAFVFLDRGIPDVSAYMDYIKQPYGPEYTVPHYTHRYDFLFILPTWEAIYTTDNERYESFKQSELIQAALINTYSEINYTLHTVPLGDINTRINFILNTIKAKL